MTEHDAPSLRHADRGRPRPKKTVLLDVAEVAEMYSVDPETVRRWARQGVIPAFKVSRARTAAYRFRLSELEADIARREKALAAGRAA